MSVMRIRYKKLGGHYHCRMFTARGPNMTFAKNGDLVFSEDEWDNVRYLLPKVEFIEEETEMGPTHQVEEEG